MAVDLAFSSIYMGMEFAVSSIMGVLSRFLVERMPFPEAVVEEMDWLKEELKKMQYFLKGAMEEQAENNRVRYGTSEIRKAAQDAEDVIEIFTLTVENRRSRGWVDVYGSLRGFVSFYKTKESIQSIRRRLDEIETSRTRYGIQDPVGGEGVHLTRRSQEIDRWRLMVPWHKMEGVVGFEKDVELLIQETILDERRCLSVATIVGMGGIGKSTLARMVYNHAAVAAQFERRAWVVVSSEFRPGEIIKELILQLLGPSEDKLKVLATVERLELPNLQHMLHQWLQGKRYFIVLDDVWEDIHWSALATAFPDEDNASRLLLTSRNRDIAEHSLYVHEMKTLDASKSWQLFLKTTFISNAGNKCPEHLENIGKEILKRCNGLPLAIKEVGVRLSKEEPYEKNWKTFLKKIDSASGGREMDAMSAVLELSYRKLSWEQKLYFLYLGFFKEGATIRAEKLVQLCIALGVFQHVGEDYEMMEYMARSYLDKLISQNMVQVEDKTKDCQVKNCHVAESFHRIAIMKAEEELSLQILREEKSQTSGRCRHCSIYCNRERSIYSVNQDTYLRSLFVYGGGTVNDCPAYWKSFKLLRVLDFEDFGLKALPCTVCALTELRYLGLRNNHILELPHSLGRLKKLEVLDIALNFMVEVPNVIWEMNRLRHLYMSSIICKTPLKIDALKNLKTLTYISVDNWAYEISALRMMTSLRKLGIEEVDEHSNISKLFTSLSKLENLECLSLRGYRFRSMPSLKKLGVLRNLTRLKLDGLLTTLPRANNFPPNLFYLTMANTSLEADPMQVLQKLSKLVYLKLRNAYTGDEMAISDEGFPQLQVLCIKELWQLRYLNIGRGAMPKLKQWEINSCPYLESPWNEKHGYTFETEGVVPCKIFEGGKDHNPLDIEKNLYETQERNGKFVEADAQEKYDEMVETVQSNPSLSHVEVSHGSKDGTRRKHFSDSQAVYIKELESKLHEIEKENENLKRRVDKIESRLVQMEKSNRPPSTSGNDIEQVAAVDISAK